LQFANCQLSTVNWPLHPPKYFPTLATSPQLVNTLNFELPAYELKIKYQNGNPYVFDEIRKKYVRAQPEEIVRQNFIKYLVIEKGYSQSLIAVEQSIKLNEMQRRADVVVYNRDGEPSMLIECKAPEVKISQKTFEQAANYNIVLKVPWLIVTNAVRHYGCKIDVAGGSYEFVDQLPEVDEVHGGLVDPSASSGHRS